jgi:hypothetical protein
LHANDNEEINNGEGRDLWEEEGVKWDFKVIYFFVKVKRIFFEVFQKGVEIFREIIREKFGNLKRYDWKFLKIQSFILNQVFQNNKLPT